MPDALRGQHFYQPGENGEEVEIRARLERWRAEVEERRKAEEAEAATTDAAARKLDG